jgi:pimeloyl-ACP methyl ester carboxylesterase
VKNAPPPGIEPQAAEESWVILDGARMRYLRSGSGPALVLLHGLLGYSFSWRLVMPALSAQATIYAVDMVGTGFSDRPPGLDCSMRASAERLLRFASEAGLSSFDLLGTSHGGAVAMRTAALAPARVRRLILAAPVNPWSKRGRWLAPFLGCRPLSALFLGLTPFMEIAHEALLRRLYGETRRIPPGTLEGYSAPLKIPGSFEYALSVLRSWRGDLRELESELPRIAATPTLLIWGSHDRAVDPASAQILRQHFQACQLRVFDSVGHLPYEEMPQQFSRTVSEFLARTSTETIL